MAGTTTAVVKIKNINGNFKLPEYGGSYTVEQTNQGGGNPGVVEIGTSEEDVSFGDITPGFVLMQNLDDTNYVKWGVSDGGTMKDIGELKPDHPPTLFWLGSSKTLRMQADTAACDVLIVGLNT